MNPKFILSVNQDGDITFILGYVINHFELCQKSTIQVLGGGWFFIAEETDTLYLYSKSSDYEQCEIADVINAFEGLLSPSIEKLNVKFSKNEKLADVLNGNYKDIISVKDGKRFNHKNEIIP